MGTSRLSAAVREGRLPGLLALRDALAKSISEAEPSARASLAKQLRDVLAEIDSLSTPAAVSAVDDLAAARAARLGRSADRPADPDAGAAPAASV